MSDEIKEILEELESMFEISELEEQVNNINKIKNCITNLQEENERLKLAIKNHSIIIPKNKVIDYKSRIEKAINFISKKIRDVALYGDQYFDLNELLQILKGVGKDE